MWQQGTTSGRDVGTNEGTTGAAGLHVRRTAGKRSTLWAANAAMGYTPCCKPLGSGFAVTATHRAQAATASYRPGHYQHTAEAVIWWSRTSPYGRAAAEVQCLCWYLAGGRHRVQQSGVSHRVAFHVTAWSKLVLIRAGPSNAQAAWATPCGLQTVAPAAPAAFRRFTDTTHTQRLSPERCAICRLHLSLHPKHSAPFPLSIHHEAISCPASSSLE